MKGLSPSRTFLYVYQLPGGYGGGETPVPIPNTAVKPSSADGTAWVTAWESRSSPGYHTDPVLSRAGFFIVHGPGVSKKVAAFT